MATYVPAKINTAYVFYVSLVSQTNTKVMQANPTLAAGDVKAAVDDAAPVNLATLPVVDGDFTKRVKVSLSTAEMNGDNITIIFSDAAGAEWCDLTINLQTVAAQIDDLAKASVCTETRLSELDAATAGKTANQVDEIRTDTENIQGRIPASLVTGRIDADVGAKTGNVALSTQEKTDVNTEVLDVMNVDVYGEPGQEALPVSNSIFGKIRYLYKFLRNKITNDGTNIKAYNDAGAVVDNKCPVSEVAGTVTRGKFISGP